MNIYVLVDDIKGVAQAPHLESQDWVMMEDCTFGFTSTYTAPEVNEAGEETAAEILRVIANSIQLTRLADRATPELNKWMVSGQSRGVAIEFCIRPDTLYMIRLDLTKAQLHTYKVDSTVNPDTIIEKYQLDFESFTMDYWVQGKTNRDKDSGRVFTFEPPK